MVYYVMSIKIPKQNTLEGLIEDLDQRGLLVLQILLGQQAMKILTEEKTKEVLSTKSNILLPKNIVTNA